MYYLQNEKWLSRKEQGELGKSSRSQWGRATLEELGLLGGNTLETLTAPSAAIFYWTGDPLRSSKYCKRPAYAPGGAACNQPRLSPVFD